MYEFDCELDRSGTDSVKWNARPDLLPLWVADMDFPVLDKITQAIQERAAHPVFGYPQIGDGYYDAVIRWMKRRHDLDIEKADIVPIAGVVPALRTAIHAFTEPGDGVLICRPVYYPFSHAIEDAGRKVCNVPLLADGTIDFPAFEKTLDRVSLVLFCSPHNPTGHVWSREELEKVVQLCLEKEVLLVCDEIHMDLTAPGCVHIPVWNVCPEIRDHSILCTAPSKTFNLAGLGTSNILIHDPDLRARFEKTMRANGAGTPGIFGLTACQAAYTHGDVWVDEVNAYIADNFSYMDAWLRSHMPEVTMFPHEGTYLAWVDFSAWDLDELDAAVLEAGLFLDAGSLFGPEGARFQRFNLACTRKTLSEALEKLERIRPCTAH